ncbi:hypothetical protein chiPu_0018477 [Chiloscyllium punctatum]|uniref:Uncharacterized protein n=1 Tax=Chiloscyllium punctatum TaxID=137246 RepID=A0A401RNK8_CHIPU|nr:hypothetical protein [Chiloscyllium punctatum]
MPCDCSCRRPQKLMTIRLTSLRSGSLGWKFQGRSLPVTQSPHRPHSANAAPGRYTESGRRKQPSDAGAARSGRRKQPSDAGAVEPLRCGVTCVR